MKPDWPERLNDDLPHYLQALELPDQVGRFIPCLKGITPLGRQVALGFSCFALKLYYMLGHWQTLDPWKQSAWISLVKSFQVRDYPAGGEVAHTAFIDPPVVKYLAGQGAWRQIARRIVYPNHLTHLQKVVIAETKQAIATLSQVDETPEQPYRGFPMTPAGVKHHLLRLDWTQPWGAGGQAAALAVFLKTQAPRLSGDTETQKLLEVCARFFTELADAQTGAYFRGGVPEHGQLVNGAMKVLTALDWLDVPIYYPDKLIDTCLERLPSPDGCHVVDAVYVLYRCLQQTNHNRAKIQAYCAQVLEMVKQHHNPDGGFSYYIGRSQTHYYGVEISQGLAESDIHGTCLLTWAIAMILEIMDSNRVGWRVIKP